MTQPVVEFENVSFAYDEFAALDDVSFTIQKKDFLGIIGPNGGGKTTLLRLILGLIQPQKGKIRIFGQGVEKTRPYIGYVPQYSTMDPDFPILVRDVVALGSLKKNDLFMWYKPSVLKDVEEVMDKLSVKDLSDKKFGSLSGGQRQRVLIARALVAHPKILILDEPTASVDPSVEKDIYELLFQLKEEMTVILVSHDLGFVSSYVTKVACVNRSLILHKTDEISVSDIRESYHGDFNMIQHHCHL